MFAFPEKFDGGQCASIQNGNEGLLCSPIEQPTKCIRIRETGAGWDWDFSYTGTSHTAGDVVGTSDGGAMIMAGGNLDYETLDVSSDTWTKRGTMSSVIKYNTYREVT